jgi:aspartate aminotransferase
MLSNRIQNIAPSMTLELVSRVAQMRSQGIDVISLSVGEPDFGTPENICNAAKAAIDAQNTKYTPVSGIGELRQAICDKLQKDNSVDYKLNEICVGIGAKQPLVNAVLTLCQAEDEVILPTPCWVSYIEMIKLAGATPVLVPCLEEEGFLLNLSAIHAHLTPRTKAILINTPNNPTGAVYTKESLIELANLAQENDFYIISDEVYEKLIYGDQKHFCIASLSDKIRERSVIINGVSKAYAMTGWRIGYAAANAEIIKGMGALQGHTTSNTCSIAQYAALEALRGPQGSVEAMRQEFDKRRCFLADRLNAMPNISCVKSEGAFYLMPNVAAYFSGTYQGKTIANSLDLSNYLLDNAKIAVVPGSAFEAPDNLRISYSNSMENLTKAMDRMEHALMQLQA